jgi:hypothetical protein
MGDCRVRAKRAILSDGGDHTLALAAFREGADAVARATYFQIKHENPLDDRPIIKFCN